jgi:hypothetical protein
VASVGLSPAQTFRILLSDTLQPSISQTNSSGVTPAATCGRFAARPRQLCGQKPCELLDGTQVLNLKLPNRYT